MSRDNEIHRRQRLRGALVKAGREERASDSLRARLIAVALGAAAMAPVAVAAASTPNVAVAKVAVAQSVTSVAPAASGGTMAAVASANGLVGWKVLAVLFAIGGIGTAATFFSTRENVAAATPRPAVPNEAPPEMAATPAPPLPVVHAEPTPSAPEPIAALSVNDLPAVKATPPVRVAAPSPSAPSASSAPGTVLSTPEPASAATASPAARLTEETRAVGAIRASLQKGDTREALRLLDAYEAEFAHGVLGEEAEVLRIETLIRAGNKDDAARRANRFLAERPSSPHAARVRTMTRRLSEPE